MTGLLFLTFSSVVVTQSTSISPITKLYAPGSYSYQGPNNQTYNYSLIKTDSMNDVFYNSILTNQSFSYFLPLQFKTGGITFQSVLHNQKQFRTIQGNFLFQAVENRSIKITFANKSLIIPTAYFKFLPDASDTLQAYNSIVTGTNYNQKLNFVYKYKNLFIIGGTYHILYLTNYKASTSQATNGSISVSSSLQVNEYISFENFIIAVNSNSSYYITPDAIFPVQPFNTSIKYIINTALGLPQIIHYKTTNHQGNLTLLNTSWQPLTNQNSFVLNSTTITFSSPGFEVFGLVPCLLVFYVTKKIRRE